MSTFWLDTVTVTIISAAIRITPVMPMTMTMTMTTITIHANGYTDDDAEVTTAREIVDSVAARNVGDRAVIIGLLAALTFSPCEGFLPVFVAGAKFGWTGFVALCGVLAVATLGGMLLLTWLTLIGFPHATFDRFERHESKVLGGLLILLGLAVLILES